MGSVVLVTITGLLACLLFQPGAGREGYARVRRLAAITLSLYVSLGAVQNLALWMHAEDTCLDGCPDDGEDRHCLPNCHSCSCGTPLARVPSKRAPVLPPRDAVPLQPWAEVRQYVPVAPLYEIFRPPIV